MDIKDLIIIKMTLPYLSTYQRGRRVPMFRSVRAAPYRVTAKKVKSLKPLTCFILPDARFVVNIIMPSDWLIAKLITSAICYKQYQTSQQFSSDENDLCVTCRTVHQYKFRALDVTQQIPWSVESAFVESHNRMPLDGHRSDGLESSLGSFYINLHRVNRF